MKKNKFLCNSFHEQATIFCNNKAVANSLVESCVSEDNFVCILTSTENFAVQSKGYGSSESRIRTRRQAIQRKLQLKAFCRVL